MSTDTPDLQASPERPEPQASPERPEPQASPEPHGSRGDVQLENEHFRVTRWTIAPGGAIPMHRHEHEYVVVPVSTGSIVAVSPSGEEAASELAVGVSYTRPAGSEHRVENRGADADIVFVEVERLA